MSRRPISSLYSNTPTVVVRIREDIIAHFPDTVCFQCSDEMMDADGLRIGDGSWELTIEVTDLQVEKTLRVTGDLHIGGVMLKLVDTLGRCISPDAGTVYWCIAVVTVILCMMDGRPTAALVILQFVILPNIYSTLESVIFYTIHYPDYTIIS